MKSPTFIEVVRADYLRDYTLRVESKDGKSKIIDFASLLVGEVYKPLRDIGYFQKFSIKFNTIEWENGADFAPEFLCEIGEYLEDICVAAEPLVGYRQGVH